jgi:glycerol transport system ATP-binding protein
MHDGAVVQMGTPAELFDKPAHTFVGYFIGSPGMNLIRAEVEGTRARVGSQTIGLSQAYRSLPAGLIELGIRPEFARLAQAGTGHPVTVRRIDDLGARRIARLDFAGTPIAALVPETLGIQGSEAGVVFDTAHLHVYANGALVEGEAIA